MPNNNNGKSKNKGAKRGKGKGKSLPMTYQPPSRYFKAIMGYCSTISLTESAAGAGNFYQYRLNSVFDPDYSSTGTTAQGFTAYASMYTNFRVLQVRAVIRAFTGSTGNITVGYFPGGNSTFTSNYQYLQAQPFAQSTLIQGNVGGGHSVKEWNQVIDLPRVFGVSKAQYMNDFDYAHTSVASPAKPVYLNIFMLGHSGTAQTAGFTVRLVFDVLLSKASDAVVD